MTPGAECTIPDLYHPCPLRFPQPTDIYYTTEKRRFVVSFPVSSPIFTRSQFFHSPAAVAYRTLSDEAGTSAWSWQGAKRRKIPQESLGVGQAGSEKDEEASFAFSSSINATHQSMLEPTQTSAKHSQVAFPSCIFGRSLLFLFH